MVRIITFLTLTLFSLPAAAGSDAPWAKPSELRGKKLIGTGQYSLNSVTPHFLADHPEFAAKHPFDGIVVLAPLEAPWCVAHGATGYNLDDIAWSTCPVPYEAVQGTISDLNRVSWASLTDNFLSYRLVYHMEDQDHRLDLTSDADWSAAEQNAALSARVCREAKLKGFWLDTEQYDAYPIVQRSYPFAKDTPEILRKRGMQWIKAVQSEFLEICIIVTFPWSNDLEEASFLFGVKDFLNGVLEGIQAPGQIVHGYENTFYYGAAPGSQYTADGFPGDRRRYQGAHDSIKQWRSYSTDPAKYDSIVKVGMAAWVESDPWNLWPGWPSGVPQNWWSNVPLALAYSDEYVWCWSEHTHYGHSMDVVNPFLASLTNQTFNTGKEAVGALDDDFSADPLLNGWYFDFDMLDIGRNPDGKFQLPVPTLDAVPYAWSAGGKMVHILGTWMTGSKGDKPARMGLQRRRYVHPIKPLSMADSFQMSLDFSVDAFGGDSENPIVLGLFNSDSGTNRQSLTLQICAPKAVTVMLSGDLSTASADFELTESLVISTCYCLNFVFCGDTKHLSATLTDKDSSRVLAKVVIPVNQALGTFALDEAGAAQCDTKPTNTPLEKAYKYRLQRIFLDSRIER